MRGPLRARSRLLAVLLPLAACAWSCSAIVGIGDVPDAPADASPAEAAAEAEAAPPAPQSEAGVRPPPRPTASSDTDGAAPKQLVFAIRAFHFGQTSLADASAVDTSAWKSIGYDIDGVITTQAAAVAGTPGTCKPVTGAPASNLADGELGRDNSFGSNLFSTINSIAVGQLEPVLQKGIDNGSSPTILFALDDVGAGPNDTLVTTSIFLTAVQHPYQQSKWDGTDSFAVDQLSLAGTTSVTDAKTRFLNGYIADDTFVATDFNDTTQLYYFYLPVGANGFVPVNFETLDLVIKLDPAHERALSATIVGVIQPKNLQPVLSTLSATYLQCSTSLNQQFETKINQAADLSLGAPSFLDTSKTCDAISVAITVDLERVALPTTSVAIDHPAVCQDAGADAPTD